MEKHSSKENARNDKQNMLSRRLKLKKPDDVCWRGERSGVEGIDRGGRSRLSDRDTSSPRRSVVASVLEGSDSKLEEKACGWKLTNYPQDCRGECKNCSPFSCGEVGDLTAAASGFAWGCCCLPAAVCGAEEASAATWGTPLALGLFDGPPAAA